jgi:NMD protein affecting ribosome stability and mRNA decay
MTDKVVYIPIVRCVRCGDPCAPRSSATKLCVACERLVRSEAAEPAEDRAS